MRLVPGAGAKRAGELATRGTQATANTVLPGLEGPASRGPGLGSRCAPAVQSPRSESPVDGLFGWKHSLLGSFMCIKKRGS